MDKRLDSLDGLRAIAILWVALYHYAVFWAPVGKGDPLLPYGDALAWIPLAEVGELGVSLFFIVSGLVIALSFTRSNSVRQFGLRRLARLWPTLAICGTLTFFVTASLGPAELQRSVADFWISLTFVPPQHVGAIFGRDEMQWLDGAYWSLWVEVRFYLIAALLYFFGHRTLLRSWGRLAAICAGIHLLALAGVGPADALSRLLFAEYQPFFTAGIALASLMRDEDRKLAWNLLASSVVLAVIYAAGAESWQIGANFVRLSAVVGCFGLAMWAVLAPAFAAPLRWRPLTALGRASYGYYLLHQNLGLALLAAVPFGGFFSIGAMLLIQGMLIGVALVLHTHAERPILQVLRAWIDGPKPLRDIPPRPAPLQGS